MVVLLSKENVDFWPILTILSRTYALFRVLFTGLNRVATRGGVPKVKNIGYDLGPVPGLLVI